MLIYYINIFLEQIHGMYIQFSFWIENSAQQNRNSCKRPQVNDHDKAVFRVPVCSVHAILIPSAKGGCCFVKWVMSQDMMDT